MAQLPFKNIDLFNPSLAGKIDYAFDAPYAFQDVLETETKKSTAKKDPLEAVAGMTIGGVPFNDFKDLPEAARVDGANEWQVFWYVIRPRLQPIMMILVVLRFGTAMAVIDEYLIFGGFNRAHPTYTWTVFMYDQAFKTGLWRQGFAASIGMVGAVVMMIFVAYLVYIFRSKD